MDLSKDKTTSIRILRMRENLKICIQNAAHAVNAIASHTCYYKQQTHIRNANSMKLKKNTHNK